MIETNETNTDTTFQTSGILRVSLTNRWPGYSWPTGIPLLFNPIIYGPPAAPPPPWTQGIDYSTNTARSVLLGTPLTSGNWGATVPLSISDMSSNKVLTGKTYAFSIYIGAGIQLFLIVTGVAGGSTVKPGFGLYGINGGRSWIYITPESFNYDYQIGLLSGWSQSVAWLSVEYAPPKVYNSNNPPPEARLNFTVSGAQNTTGGQPGEADLSSPDPDSENFFSYLHPRSDPYVSLSPEDLGLPES